MHTDNVGLTAVIMIVGIPMAAMYTFYRVLKLRTEEPCGFGPRIERSHAP